MKKGKNEEIRSLRLGVLPGNSQYAEHPYTPCPAPTLQPHSERAGFPQALSAASESS